jgi:plastocyanin
MYRIPVAVAVVTVALLASSSAHAAPVAAAPHRSVPISADAFTPKAITLPLDGTVTWTNTDRAPHTATGVSGPARFDSGVLATGRSYSHTFTEAGTYRYYCAVHPDMVGTVTVSERPAEPAAAHRAAPTRPAQAKPAPTKPAHAKPAPAKPVHTAPRPAHAGPEASAPRHGPASPMAPAAPAAPEYPAAPDPVTGILHPLMADLATSRLDRGGGDQLERIAAVDSWALSRERLIRTMLDFEVGRRSVLGRTTGPDVVLAHLDAAHWNRSPSEQVANIANFDTWARNHVALGRTALEPVVGQDSVLGRAAVTGPVFAHLDAAHWYRTPAGQVADVLDLEQWLRSHAALAETVLTGRPRGI